MLRVERDDSGKALNPIRREGDCERVKGGREGGGEDGEGEHITNGHPAGGNRGRRAIVARVHEWRRLKAMPPSPLAAV